MMQADQDMVAYYYYYYYLKKNFDSKDSKWIFFKYIFKGIFWEKYFILK